MVRCLQKPFGVSVPQQLERENDAVYYDKVYKTCIIPEIKKFGRKWMYTYNM